MAKSTYLFFIWLTLLSCNDYPKASIASKALVEQYPSLRELVRELRSQRKIVIVYPDQLPAYRALAEQVAGYSGRYIELEARPASSFDPKAKPTEVLMLLGMPESNPLIGRIENRLPVELGETTITFDGKSYRDQATIFCLPFYPNPLNPKLPVMVISGMDDQELVRFVSGELENSTSFFGWSLWGYELWQHGKRLLLGYFDEETWKMSKERHFDFSNGMDTFPDGKYYQFIGHQLQEEGAQRQAFERESNAMANDILTFTGLSGEGIQFQHHLYPSAEEKGLITRNTEQSHVDFSRQEVHSVLNETYKGNLIGKENELLLRSLLGKPATLALERGLAVYFTKSWQWRGYQHWTGRLFRSGNLLPLSELLAPDMQDRNSRLIAGCLNASFVAFLIESWGREAFLEKYPNWSPTAKEIPGLEEGWRRFLSGQAHDITLDRPEQVIPFLKGFNFAHEGYSIYNGYISREATRSLETLSSMSVNAVAIVPYSYMEQHDAPSFIPIADSPGSENDESVIHSAAMAHKEGMTVMLKPQIWLGRGNWPGDVAMTSAADWQQFFDKYYRWILHYALLAEIHQVELLCIGTEFVQASLQRPADWRRIIGKLRGVYSGKLTYAANWGEEFEKLSFWNDLDYIGLNCYYPLSQEEKPGKAALKANFQKTLDKIEARVTAIGKPLIFTEIGFPAIDAPWKNPHQDDRQAPFNAEHQKVCYEVVLEGIANKEWCQGILWWKFPANHGPRWADSKGFTPHAKPAEKVVADWFSRMPLGK